MATRKPTNIGKFNDTIDNIFSIIEQRYQGDGQEQIEYHKYQLDLARRSNPRLVVEKFMTALTPFIGQIMTRQEAFFLELDLAREASDNQIINNIKEIWQNHADDKLKDKIWKLFQLLLMYGAMVTCEPSQLTEINKYRSTPLKV